MATRVVEGAHDIATELPLLHGVQGHHVTGVEVVDGASHGALLFEFGGARLEILSKASVWQRGVEYSPGHPQWREALSRCLQARVAQVTVEAGHELTIDFDHDLHLVVSLEPGDHRGPDAAAFFDENWHYEPF